MLPFLSSEKFLNFEIYFIYFPYHAPKNPGPRSKCMYFMVFFGCPGETQKQKLILTEDQIKMSLEAQEEGEKEPKKKMKKVVKKKKKKEEKKEVKAPEVSSFLKSLIKQEGESFEMKCRLEEEMEVEDVKVQWFLNDTEMEENEHATWTFDGTYAIIYINE